MLLTKTKTKIMNDNNDIFLDAIKTFGVKNQREMMVEECSEITKTIQKLKRLEDDVIKGRISPKSIKFKSKQERLQKDFVKELVDVEIVLSQLKKVVQNDFYNEARTMKLNRLALLIKAEKLRQINVKKKSELQTENKDINVDEITVNKIRNGKANKSKPKTNHIRNQMKKISKKTK
jgi:hypothetical protein